MYYSQVRYGNLKNLICSTIVIFVALIALASIWCPDIFPSGCQYFYCAIDWLLTLIVLVLAVLLFLCIYYPVQYANGKQTPVSNDQEAEPKKLESPYPDDYDSKPITKFSYDSDLVLMRLKTRLPNISPEAQYIVAKDYTISFVIDGQKHSITVPKGLLTDLASVPQMFRFIAGRVGPHLEACVVHDYLYAASQINNISPTEDMRRFADRLMLVAMLAAGMGCKAHLIYWAVRCFGRPAFFREINYDTILSGSYFPQRPSNNGEKTDSDDE